MIGDRMRAIGRYVRRHHVALVAMFVALGGTSYAAAVTLPANSVGTSQIKNNAVTLIKIAPPAQQALRGARVVVVNASGTAAANGKALVHALAGITHNSATTPYLLKLEPGIYNVSSSPLTDKSYVDIEGSGPDVTQINATKTGNLSTLTMPDHSAVGDVSVRATATGGYAVGVWVDAGAHVDLSDVNASAALTASTGAPTADGLFSDGDVTAVDSSFSGTATGTAVWGQGVLVNSGDTTLLDDTLTASSSGTTTATVGLNDFGTAAVRDSTITANPGSGATAGAVLTQGTGSATIEDSALVAPGGGEAVATYGTSTLEVATSRVDGTAVHAAGTLKCIDSYKGDFATATSSSCT
jgi:hypothetical protein